MDQNLEDQVTAQEDGLNSDELAFQVERLTSLLKVMTKESIV